MQIIIHLDAESARQLVEIQAQTEDRDYSTILYTGIGLYHQQIQLSDRLQLAQHQQSVLEALGITPVGQI